jgi:hypothetical protein
MASLDRPPHPATLSHAARRAPSTTAATPAAASISAPAAHSKPSRTSASGRSFDDTLDALIDQVAIHAKGKRPAALYSALKQEGYGAYLGAQNNVARLAAARTSATSLGIGVASRGRHRGEAALAIVATRELRVSDADDLVYLSIDPARADAAAALLVMRKTPSSTAPAERLYLSANNMRQATDVLECVGLAAPTWASTPARLRAWTRLMAAIQAAC